MKKKLHHKILFLALTLGSLTIFSCQNREKQKSNVDFVDPRIGGVAPLLQPTRTRIHLPNSMVRVYPERKDYLDDQIYSFPLLMLNHRSTPLFSFLPVDSGISEQVIPVSAWDKELEIAKPYYYSTWLEDFGITIEYTPAKQSGFYTMLYPKGGDKKIFLKATSGENWTLNNDGSLTATESFNGMNAFAYCELDKEVNLKYVDTNAWLLIPESKDNQIKFKYGISYISPEQAKINLYNEIPDWNFEDIKKSARALWNETMNKIEVEGGTESYKRTFYTALYRSYERMINISESGRYYSNYDSTVHSNERDFYVDDWVWDTYLALHPLRFILNPEMESDMIDSYIRMYKQSGWLPQFPQVYGDTPPMNGFHSTILILDAWRKGIRNIDIEVAYEAMKKNAMKGTMVPWRMGAACELDTFYFMNGYFPGLHPGEKESVKRVHDFEKRQSVAVTLAHSYDDWALAELAMELGKKEDHEYFSNRALNYKNLYWEEKGFFMPKDKRGDWIDIDPKFDGGMGGRDYYDENNGWTYLWNVQQDIPGLIKLMGGKEIFENRLDQHFREDLGRTKYELYARFPDFTGIVGQFSMGNEPSFHIPYLYNLTDSPWKTQKKIRMLLNTWFKDNIFGIPGDEDGGGMSAFVVFSAMGFYPLTPGLPVYTIGSPLFTKVTINLPEGKKFIISAPKCSLKNKYIQKARLNGKLLNSPFFTHEELTSGGLLELEMGEYPNKEWGRDTTRLPEYYQ